MRVGILADAFPPTVGGIEIFADQYVRELAASPAVDAVDVLAFADGDDERGDDLWINRASIDGTLARCSRGLAWARRGGYDVVHSLSLYPGGVTAAVANFLGLADRTFVTVYGTDALGSASRLIHRQLRRFVFRTVTEVFFFSDSTRQKTHDAYGCAFPSRTIYPGIPRLSDGTVGFEPPDTAGSFTVLSVCRLVERKGIDDLVEAVAGLPDISLWVVGDGPERPRLERLVRDHGIDDRVAFVGRVDHDTVVDYYRAADVFAMPSVHLRDEGDVEGLGLVFLEAQQLGLPVVGTDSGGIPEAIADGESGFVVSESSPDELRDAIRTLASDPDRYRAFSSGATEFVHSRFSWQRCVDTHLEAYRANPNADD
jgi:phosphatidylinositol alpha-1,6-mannosyltransferase